LRVLFVSSEIYPLAKTGGLGDVGAALPSALARLGVEMHLLLPGYPSALQAAIHKSVRLELADFMGRGTLRLIEARVPDTGLPIWLMDCPSLFARSGAPYQNEDGVDWPDNAQRFAAFSHLAAALARGDLLPGERADIVHVNDWHAALVPLLLAAKGGNRPATLLTVHNLAFQGLFPAEFHAELQLPDDPVSAGGLEFYGKISFLKAGIRFADQITTVSPAYAREILTPEFGCGLEGLLNERAADVSGILNGVDYRIWDPARDPFISANFAADDISGKRVCKSELQRSLGLVPAPQVPLIVYLSRLTDQKMADLVLDALPALLARDVEFALLGDGDPAIERRLRDVAGRYPGQLAVRIGYEEPLAHRLYAGADILLHPARFEPCGLAPLYALRYGTLPIVRHVGGLADTIIDACDRTPRSGAANGFAFRDDNAAAMLACVDRALACYRQPVAWRRLQRTAMNRHFGWDASAKRYLALYRALAPGDAVIDAAAGDLWMEGAAD
jgi:starch synthase